MADKKNDDLGAAQVQEKVDKENEQGYAGSVPDPTPNEAYTVAGVLKNMPTSEKAAPTAAQVRENFAPLSKGEQK